MNKFTLLVQAMKKLTEQRYFRGSRKKIKVETKFEMLASNEVILENGKEKLL